MPAAPTEHRISYFGRETPSPALPALGQDRKRHTRPGLDLHTHPVWEVCFIQAGHADWVLGDQTHHLAPGDVFVTPPQTPHGSPTGQHEPFGLTWFQIDPSQLPLNPQLNLPDAWPRLVWHEPDLEPLTQLHQALLRECQHTRPDSRQLAEATAAVLFLNLHRRAGQASDPPPRPDTLQKLLDWLDAQPPHRITLADLEAVTGLRRSRIHQLVRRHLNQSPSDLLMLRRLQHAKHRLATTNHPITDIALGLDFSSSQHFANTFRQHFGLTPSVFRQQTL